MPLVSPHVMTFGGGSAMARRRMRRQVCFDPFLCNCTIGVPENRQYCAVSDGGTRGSLLPTLTVGFGLYFLCTVLVAKVRELPVFAPSCEAAALCAVAASTCASSYVSGESTASDARWQRGGIWPLSRRVSAQGSLGMFFGLVKASLRFHRYGCALAWAGDNVLSRAGRQYRFDLITMTLSLWFNVVRSLHGRQCCFDLITMTMSLWVLAG